MNACEADRGGWSSARRTWMIRVIGASLSVVVASGAASADVTLGPDWPEGFGGSGDAGSFGSSAQQTDGAGKLESIGGMLEGETGAGPPMGDFEDLYRIHVCEPGAFRASTLGADGGFASFNVQLWLFEISPSGFPELRGLLANDDAGSGTARAVIPFMANDGFMGNVEVEEEGRYVIGVTGFDNDPGSGPPGMRERIFFQPPPFTEVSGPDGPDGEGEGGAMDHTFWFRGATPQFGSYIVALEGVTYFRGATTDCNGNQRFDNCDIAFGDSEDLDGDGVPDECCRGDLDMKGAVDTPDLLILLGGWGGPGPGSELAEPTDVIDVADLLALLEQWGPCS